MNHPENRWNPQARPVAPAAETGVSAHLGAGETSLTESAAASAADPATQKITENPGPASARRDQTQSLTLHAILGAGTALHGALSFSGRVRIDGQLEGSATGGDLLIIGEGARVTGQLRARKVIVLGGHVEADISASESIELYIPAVVKGDLRSPQIYMDRGIQFHGTCDMTLDPPTVELRPDSDDG